MEDTIASFILMKPDALRDHRIQQRIHELLESCPSQTEQSWTLDLDQAQISRLWPQYFRNDCPVTVRFLAEYLTTSPVEVVTMTGETAVEDALEVKRRIRKEYATSPFSNCVHAPDDANSAAEQLLILDHARDEAIEINPFPTFGRPLEALMGQNSAELDLAVQQLWRDAWTRGWDGVWADPPSSLDSDVEVILVSDTDHTLDYAISGLLFAVPNLELKDAIALVLRTSLEERAVVARTDAASANAIRDALRGVTLRAEVQTPATATSELGPGGRD